MKRIEHLKDQPIFSEGRRGEREVIGFRPAGVPDLAQKVAELVSLINEQQQEIEKLKRINELNYSTFKSVKEWDYIPGNWLATELGLNIEKADQ